eukprot:CAMPEP_0185530626 /NCGR_PEP_ID=MMETSP1366-20130426/104496_1 /TAXON_ID=38817 /ORGANISM="Gephyrocapsa oceanica, Strain RCC1303" /LENGTH=64 /DNA_ID=CAMNT_0028142291 /DNA_START=96 /DNA_END=290 /DNA_ORIENTATION=+
MQVAASQDQLSIAATVLLHILVVRWPSAASSSAGRLGFQRRLVLSFEQQFRPRRREPGMPSLYV